MFSNRINNVHVHNHDNAASEFPSLRSSDMRGEIETPGHQRVTLDLTREYPL